MKKLLACILCFGFWGTQASAQQLQSFSTGIFKEIKTPEASPASKEVHISDFQYQPDNNANTSIWELPKTNPGVAFATSALVPGAGQAFNSKWVRAGVYFAIEAAGILYHLDRNSVAKRQEEAYEEFTHENWSVVAYAQWLVQYSDANDLSQDQLDELRGMVFSNGRPISPNWGDTPEDWGEVNIGILRNVENQTPFILNEPDGCWDNDPPNCNRRSEFSHELPQYGSQQYYELISKYYQYQSGWRDWYTGITTAENQSTALYQYMWNGQDQPFTLFYEGRDRAQEFNDNYRKAGNILKLLLVNHVVSAFDALFTVQLKNSRLETETNMLSMEQFSLTWHF